MANDAAVARLGTRAPATALAAARAVPTWAWLGALVVASTGIRYGLAQRVVAPWVMVDELIYSELAKSFAATGRLLVREHSTGGYGPLYPIVASTAYALWHAPTAAYEAIKAINSLLMSLAAVPAYLLAGRVVRRPLALTAAVLAVAVPSLAYTGNVLTENLFYPLFLVEALLLVRLLERPSVARSLALYGVWLVAYLTRPQAVAILPAIVTAIVLVGGRATLRRYAAPLGILGAAFLLALAAQLGRGRSLTDLLGAYKVTSQEHYTVGAVAKWLLYHVCELDLYTGVAPFAALMLLALRARSLTREQRLFVAAAASLCGWLLLEVATFASLPSVTRIEERYDFYVAPLLFVALLVVLERRLRRDRLTLVVGAVCAGLVAVLPFNSLIGTKTISDTLMLLPWWWLHDRLTHDIRLLAVLLALAAAAIFVRFPRALPALLLSYFALASQPIDARIHQTSLGALFEGLRAPKGWIDAAVPRGTRVVALHATTRSYTIWENEFFNRSVGRVLYLVAPTGGNLPETRVHEDLAGVVRFHDGRPVRARYLLVGSSAGIDGRVVADDPGTGMELLRVPGIVRTAARVTGVNFVDTWSQPGAAYTRFRCHGGVVVASVASDASLFHVPQTVTARVAGRVAGRVRLAPGTSASLRVPLRGGCTVRYTVSPTAVPARVLRGSIDTRRLGVHFDGFTYRP